MSAADVDVTWRGEFTSTEANRLHAVAFGTRVFSDEEWEWRLLVERHSLGWCTARVGGPRGPGALVGFANVVWDGSVHAWLQDVMVDVALRGSGVGRRLVDLAADEAARAGCEWLHVDFDEKLAGFYLDRCGFERTSAGLRALRPSAG